MSIEKLVFELGKDNDKTFIRFLSHATFLSVTGLVLGTFIEVIMKRISDYSDNIYVIGLSQYLLNVVVLYFLTKHFFTFSSEFQKTYSGLLFVVFFFGAQINLITRANLLVPNLPQNLKN